MGAFSLIVVINLLNRNMPDKQTDFFNFGNLLAWLGIHDKAVTLTESRVMFNQMFLWYLVSSFFVHTVAAAIAFCFLKKHRWARWYFTLMLIMGLVGPVTNGIITSCVISILYKFGGWVMPPYFPLCFGLGQSLAIIFLSFFSIPATL